MRKGWMRGAAAAAVLAGLAWLWLQRVGNDTGTGDFRDNRPTITAAEAGSGPERMAAALVERWMRRFTTGEYGRASRLRDYRVNRVAVAGAGERRYVVAATVSVRPTRASFGSWLAGSGGTVREGWIHGKFLRFSITPVDGGYQLTQVGPGPL